MLRLKSCLARERLRKCPGRPDGYLEVYSLPSGPGRVGGFGSSLRNRTRQNIVTLEELL